MAKKKINDADEVIRLSREYVATDEQKAAIKALYERAGIEEPFNENCPNCWHDALAVLRNHYGIKAEEVKVKPDTKVIVWR